MNPRQVQRVKDAAIALYKAKHFEAYDPELQTTICTILAFAEVWQQEGFGTIEVKIADRLPYEPIDQE